MSSEETNLTCPNCGNEVDVADSLRMHIEHELRAEIQKTTREEYDSQIKSIRQEEEEKQEEQKVKIASQREELKLLRKSQLELDELKETRDVELAEARAAGEKSVKDELKAAKAEASKAHTQLEEIKEDYEDKIAKARADEQKSAKGELKKALASAKEAESKLKELKADAHSPKRTTQSKLTTYSSSARKTKRVRGGIKCSTTTSRKILRGSPST